MLKPPAAMALPVLALMRRLKLVRFGPVQWMRLQSSVPLEVERMVQTLGCRPRYSTRQTLALWRTHHRAQGGEAHTSAYGRDLIQ